MGAMLKYTKVTLDLLTDYEMLNFIQGSIRGGISQCCHRYAKANNKFTNAQADMNSLSSFILYLDANNLYVWAMSQPLPQGNFKWVDEFNLDITLLSDDDPEGYIFDIDIEYPKELHSKHNDFPFYAKTNVHRVQHKKNYLQH